MRALLTAVGILLLILLPPRPTAASEVIEIAPRPGVTLRLLADVPGSGPIAVLFAGGHGRLKLDSDGSINGLNGNFLVRSRDRFVAGGVGVVLFDAPSDHQDKEGLTYGYRMLPEHAADIGVVIAAIRVKFPDRQVWLVGTSRGSISAANGAVSAEPGPDGLVLTSAVGMPFKKGGNIRDLNLGSLKMPVLVVHHVKDGCVSTPPEGAKAIRDALKGSARADLIMIEGGESGGNPCQGKSHQGFMGIEDRAVDAITAFIKAP